LAEIAIRVEKEFTLDIESAPMSGRPPRPTLATLYSWRAWAAKLSAVVIHPVAVRLISVYSRAGRNIEIKAWTAGNAIGALCRNDRHFLPPHPSEPSDHIGFRGLDEKIQPSDGISPYFQVSARMCKLPRKVNEDVSCH